jgi:hypothetical protein
VMADIEDLQRKIDDRLSGHGKDNEFIGEAAPETTRINGTVRSPSRTSTARSSSPHG